MTTAKLRATAEEEPEIKAFAAQLKVARRVAKLSRAELAKRADLSEATIKFLETCRVRPTIKSVSALLSVPELGLAEEVVPSFLRIEVEPILAHQRTTTARQVHFLCVQCRALQRPCTLPHDYCTQTSYKVIFPTEDKP